ncbi:hypothetical protein KP79_PYT11596 [Mizuhopecten yessoensis]|uniref:Uncharacterized protein n=1 Tax=Mizuhopecten yessoensis TaxID=6573 RepID=A0A210QAD2_MIZYE|nr:hypothetical protein KP79_PYT11596 [Mizuhopecten yessoensis]
MKFSITAKGLCLLLWMVAFLHEGQAQICPLGCTPQYELITESCRKLIFFRRRCTSFHHFLTEMTDLIWQKVGGVSTGVTIPSGRGS